MKKLIILLIIPILLSCKIEIKTQEPIKVSVEDQQYIGLKTQYIQDKFEVYSKLGRVHLKNDLAYDYYIKALIYVDETNNFDYYVESMVKEISKCKGVTQTNLNYINYLLLYYTL